MTSLTIDLAAARIALPAELEQRLNGSPTKTPDELAATLAECRARSEKLRNAHLDSVRDRAARESQRAAEATARKLRLAHMKMEKVQKALEAAETKTNAKREATEAQREARKARRAEMASAVAAARQAALEARGLRSAQLLEAEKLASAKHAKTIREIHDKGAWQVTHAQAVVKAQKEKERLQTERANARFVEKLERAAEARRDAVAYSTPPRSPTRARVLNDAKVESEMKRLRFEAAMSKAESNREALLLATREKAALEIARVDSVVAAVAERKDKPISAKASLFEKLQCADVARHTHLLSKVKQASPAGDTVSVIVVRVDSPSPRMPPPALLKRLSALGRGLVNTAAVRQAGAASRREAIAAAASLKRAQARAKRADAARRVAASLAGRLQAIETKSALFLVASSLRDGARAHAKDERARRVAAAAARRAEGESAAKTKAEAAQKACAAADERRVKRLHTKSGDRTKAFKERRASQDQARLARFGASTIRSSLASSRRASLLEARVATAQKRMKAMHPKREVADMEISQPVKKDQWSEA